MIGHWFDFVNILLGAGTKWYCNYRNYRMEDFFIWCDLDGEDMSLFWEANNDNDYIRIIPPSGV